MLFRSEQATYRVEVAVSGVPGSPPVPWLVGNPIYVNPARQVPNEARGLPSLRTAFTLEQLGRGRIERSQDSAGAITLTPGNYQREVLYRYALGGSPSEHPYAAAVFSLEQPLENYAGVSFVARAERPLRMSEIGRAHV